MYHVFAGDSYYPSGGAEDFVAAFDDLDQARASARGLLHNGKGWAQVAWFDSDANTWRVERVPSDGVAS